MEYLPQRRSAESATTRRRCPPLMAYSPRRYYVRFECDDHTAAAEAVLLKVRHPTYQSTLQYPRVPYSTLEHPQRLVPSAAGLSAAVVACCAVQFVLRSLYNARLAVAFLAALRGGGRLLSL